MIHSAYGILALLIPVGCSQAPSTTSAPPEWIQKPKLTEHSVRFISAIGTGDTALTQKELTEEAEDAARTELAKEINRYCRKTLTDFIRSLTETESDSNLAPADREFVNIVSSSTTNAILRRTVRHDTWSVEGNKAITVLYRVPIRNVHNAIQMEAETAFENIAPSLDQGKEDMMEELASFLDSQLKKQLTGTEGDEKVQRTQHSDNYDQIPNWLSEGHTETFPPQQYIVATGLGENREAARKSARRYIYRQIRKRMSNLTSRLISEDQGSLADNLSQLPEKSFTIKTSQIEGIQTPKHWFDTVTETYYLLAVLERGPIISRYRKTALRNAKECQESFNTANNHYRAGNIKSAIRDYLSAIQSLSGKIQYQFLARALTYGETNEADLPETPAASTIKNKLNSLLENMSLEKLSGDNQWISPEQSSPSRSLQVRLTKGPESEPIPDLPLSFKVTKGDARLDFQTNTDSNGRAHCSVHDISPKGDGVITIRCLLHLDALGPESDLSGLKPPSTSFRLIIRSVEDTWFAIVIQGAGKVARITETVRKELGKAGYNVIRQKEAEKHLGKVNPGNSLSWAFPKLANGFQTKKSPLLLSAKAESKIVEQRDTSEGTMFFAHTPVQLRVIDPSLPSDTLARTFSVTGKGAYAGDSDEASKRACAHAGQLLAKRLVEWLDDKFRTKQANGQD